MQGFFILAILFALATLGILVTGVIGMAKQNDFNKKYGNKLMRARVVCQFIAVLLLLAMAIASGK